ncbi:Degradation activator [Delftia tsuruhatensis]|nr:Degradation activator [Delftia tsuruhatensis]CAC9693554.1 Degradation activator [Delftia tsuruhatensis]
MAARCAGTGAGTADPLQSTVNRPRTSTIYDLAELAGTSASTVSAILNGSWQARRIRAETAQRVLALAQEHSFAVNRQASGLRRQRSGLIGMVIPTHEDRFFGALSQAFERQAHERGLCPLVVSTLRDGALEVETVRSLIAFRVEHLIVTGATRPDAISAECRQAGVRHVNVDLPGRKAPSVTSDNRWGAAELTRLLLARAAEGAGARSDAVCFLGGIRKEYATEQRIAGFSEALAPLQPVPQEHIVCCGYEPEAARQAMAALHERLGGLPRALLFASGITLQGAIRFLRELPDAQLAQCAFGSYDWDPYAECLRFPVHMVRQNVEGLMAEAFRAIDGEGLRAGQVVQVRPQLVVAGAST